MTVFIVFAVALIVVFLGFVFMPFWFAKRTQNDTGISNPEVVKQRLSELEVEKREALLSISDFEEAVVETKLSLADELESDDEDPRAANQKTSKWLLFATAILPIVAAVWVYADINQVEELKQWQRVQNALPELGQKIVVQANNQVSREELAEFALALRTKLHTQKEDAVGWLLLGRVLTTLTDMQGAIAAFDKSLEIEPERPGTLFSYAQALLLTSDSDNIVRAQRVLEQLEQITPQDNNVAGLLAVAYTRNNAPEKAIAIWQRLQSSVAPDDPMYNTIQQQLAALQTGGSITESSADDGTELRVSVSIAPELQVNLDAMGFLFVFVQDADSENRMPVAVKKIPLTHKTQKEAISVVLSNQNAMLQDFNLSKIVNGRLIARLSKDENVASASGEFQGEMLVPIQHGQSKNYSLKIDEELM
ncbi:c-type cytochrome biogenesis protein CcmI [Planctobacterium marinum]|uniref:C-type cytochrome biogenesis protein CcmI n=1 Tax=Planctobacterium marinum TaxID=1631968 RepID=A0AA48HQA9_9ALTE|nr:c-type cytochrome biogenesis protein CcmI [Planctobacterium marinum]